MKFFVFTILIFCIYSSITEVPLLFYSFLIYYSRILFNYGLFTILFVFIILFKLRYRWEREGINFAIKILMIIITTGSFFSFSSLSSNPYLGLQKFNNYKETNFIYVYKLLNIFLFSIASNGLFVLYCNR